MWGHFYMLIVHGPLGRIQHAESWYSVSTMMARNDEEISCTLKTSMLVEDGDSIFEVLAESFPSWDKIQHEVQTWRRRPRLITLSEKKLTSSRPTDGNSWLSCGLVTDVSVSCLDSSGTRDWSYTTFKPLKHLKDIDSERSICFLWSTLKP